MKLSKIAGETIINIVFRFDTLVSHCQILRVLTRCIASERSNEEFEA
jgi:hypothetical protein